LPAAVSAARVVSDSRPRTRTLPCSRRCRQSSAIASQQTAADRPTARAIVDRIDGGSVADAGDAQHGCDHARRSGAAAKPGEAAAVPERLGRFPPVGETRAGRDGHGFTRRKIWANGTIVAIKVLNPELARNPAALKRFQKEALMMAAVRNPHTANLIEVNEQDGVHYLAMEFVAGRSLRALLGPAHETC